jgi:hypothetical protein
MDAPAPQPNTGFAQAEGVPSLEARVRSQLRGRIRDLRLVVTDKGIVLQGSAGTYYAKQLAQHAVMGAAGLPILANEIEVS